VRGEEDSLARFAGSGKACQQVGATGADFVKFHVQSDPSRGSSKKVRDALFSRMRVVRRQKGRIHARKRDEFAKKFCCPTHADFRALVLPAFQLQEVVNLPARYLFAVAQIFNLPYRRFVIDRAWLAGDISQVKNLRYSAARRSRNQRSAGL
jgi:hypothetical protein